MKTNESKEMEFTKLWYANNLLENTILDHVILVSKDLRPGLTKMTKIFNFSSGEDIYVLLLREKWHTFMVCAKISPEGILVKKGSLARIELKEYTEMLTLLTKYKTFRATEAESVYKIKKEALDILDHLIKEN